MTNQTPPLCSGSRPRRRSLVSLSARTARLRYGLLALASLSLLLAGCQGAGVKGQSAEGSECRICEVPAKRGIPLTAAPDPCAPGQSKTQVKPREGDAPFRLTSCQVQQDIKDLFVRVPTATPWQWNQIAQKVIAFGPDAVPQVAANLDSGVHGVPVMAAYVLGKLEDPRALDALYQATFSKDPAVRYEAATSMVRMGDRRGLPVLIEGLEDRDPLVRARAIIVLYERTGETKDYKADDRPQERSAAVARWRAWYQATGA
jgi:hypothetical protein